MRVRKKVRARQRRARLQSGFSPLHRRRRLRFQGAMRAPAQHLWRVLNWGKRSGRGRSKCIRTAGALLIGRPRGQSLAAPHRVRRVPARRPPWAGGGPISVPTCNKRRFARIFPEGAPRPGPRVGCHQRGIAGAGPVCGAGAGRAKVLAAGPGTTLGGPPRGRKSLKLTYTSPVPPQWSMSAPGAGPLARPQWG